MSTSFSSLPIISLSSLSKASCDEAELLRLSAELDHVFSTTGFAYLTDLPLTYTHEDVFGICDEFFGPNGVSTEEKMKLAKRTFVPGNKNTYRGYFPPQQGSDNLKEGFELGTPSTLPSSSSPNPKFNLTEPNVFPSSQSFRTKCETLHTELQNLSTKLLSLLAVSLGKPSTFFENYLTNSLSTLRLLHYPPVPASRQQELICTPHTDSGILTLLHQDSTGGLEVLNSKNEWIPAPYVPGSVVVNIGDLMAKVSGGRWVATLHRVRAAKRNADQVKGRHSVPFFFEPGAECVVRSLDGEEVIYGKHVVEKMSGWVEFQDVIEEEESGLRGVPKAVEVY
ncbi:Clavaminate synthase-like protein [Glarea lozoyensis ATCC 20868]|uniref:Clavaminate synthase-like protein n=2 Tax=Glarea lozoyensis TaxID=101852 RepID=S3CYN9_GLAL2|nr:Clavaminate synthase-like protein [Glarea lozoyensis ATCC 20868]EHK97282.1 putative iron/ascorbate oxidoreductase [Glarea lozoyensis 74030]EPE31377.1 Clavaminate synthase-like protein [Glarea lozoyensis ATCC 20868]